MSEMGAAILIGIDDTDVPNTRGTGWRARGLSSAIAELGYVTQGVTRHQLLVDDRIPYTSHNSSACIAVDPSADLIALWDLAQDFLIASSEAGSDPGLCVARRESIPQYIVDFGRRAQKEVLTRDMAEALAQEAGMRLAGLGGTCDGVIGSLAAVGLQAAGNDGRYIELGSIRALVDVVSVGEILSAGVDEVRTGTGSTLDSEEEVETLNWVRPDLRGGRAVMTVERSGSHGGLWKPVGRTHRKSSGRHG